MVMFSNFYLCCKGLRMYFGVLLLAFLIALSSSETDKPENGDSSKKLSTPSRNQHPVCAQTDTLHSDVVRDHGLTVGMNPDNYTFLGNVQNMGDCMALCCSTKHCNIAYMQNASCFGVTCYDADRCAVKNSTVESGTKLALMIRNEMGRRVYVTAYLVVVVCAFGAAMAGTVWAMFIFYKRYTTIGPPKDADEDNEELMKTKQAKVY